MADKSTNKSLLSTPNLFWNSSILILTVVIIFLTYSLINRLNILEDATGEINSEKHSKTVQVEVLNGCGVSGVADIFTDSLRTNGVDVVSLGNYKSFDIDNTIVIDRSGKTENAKFVAGLLGVDKNLVVRQINKNYFLDVCVIIGKDYNNYFKN